MAELKWSWEGHFDVRKEFLTFLIWMLSSQLHRQYGEDRRDSSGGFYLAQDIW